MTRPVVHLSEQHRQEIIDHCLSELPNEGCGLLAVDGGHVVAVYPTKNIDISPTSYTVDPADHIAALTEAESHGWSLGGVFHSHPDGPATMSDIDMDRGREPDWVYVVVGLESGRPEVGVFSI